MESTNFDSQLARLKQALGVAEDQAAAKALGLSKAALSARKKRGAFPETELRALAQQRPELSIHVEYVLTGEIAQARGASNEDEGPFRVTMALTVTERELLEHYRKCSDTAQAALLQLAKELAK